MVDFTRPLSLDQIRDGERLRLIASDQDRAEIADRLRLPRIDRLEASVALDRSGPEVRATGRLFAVLEQCCVVTNEPVAAHIDAPFELRFAPEPKVEDGHEEIELSPEECDVVFYDGAAIDLGAALADTLALSVDPFPRSAGADAALKEAGVLGEEQAGPFAALEQLKRKLDGPDS